MARRGDGHLFVGRLAKDVRTRDLEDVFELYGRLTRCDIKYGAEMAYAFIDYEDRRDAEDAIKYENGRQIRGSSIVVEWTKGAVRQPGSRREMVPSSGVDECYKCYRVGHWARDCPEDRNAGRRPSYGRDRPRRRSPRSRSPRRRSPTRSRSRDRRRHRSRSRSGDKRRKRSPSKSRSRTPVRKSGSKSPRAAQRSRSRSRAASANGDGAA